MEEAGAMAPRVLVVQRPVDTGDVEQAIAVHGPEAITRAACEPFDALVVDLSLPVLDGWFVLAAIANCSQRPRIVVIASDPNDVTRAVALGADEVLERADLRGAFEEAIYATA
jgi:CheY-like chemotaxis protein